MRGAGLLSRAEGSSDGSRPKNIWNRNSTASAAKTTSGSSANTGMRRREPASGLAAEDWSGALIGPASLLPGGGAPLAPPAP